ncbi:MAG: ribosome maturation factor RimP [Clostridia bacterium]
MAKARVKDIIEQLAKPIVASLGLELVEVEYVREGKELFLRIYIYNEAGVSIDDCVAVNKLMDEELERVDPIAEPYTLEVSSPGLDRPFRTARDFERYEGELVEVQLFQPEDGKKFFEGTLIGLRTREDTTVVAIDMEGVLREFPKAIVATVKRKIVF